MRVKPSLSLMVVFLLALGIVAQAQKRVGVTIHSHSQEFSEWIMSSLCGPENNRQPDDIKFTCEIQQNRPESLQVIGLVETLETKGKLDLRVSVDAQFVAQRELYVGGVLTNFPKGTYKLSTTVTSSFKTFVVEIENLVRDRLKPSLREAARR
jgi:hypothetical protein